MSVINVTEGRHVFIAGKTGYGKSHFAKELLFSSCGKKDAVFVDIKNDPRHLHLQDDGVPSCHSLEEVKKGLEKHWVVHFVVPKKGSMDEYMTEEMDPLFEWCLERGNITVFIDEAAVICGSSKIGRQHYVAMITGEALGVNVVNVTQRPNRVDNTLLSESEYKVLFRQQLKSDRDKVKGAVGEEIADEITGLEKYEFLFVQGDGEYVKGRLGR